MYTTEKLGVPQRGRFYNIVVRRYHGDPITGLTIGWDKTVKPLPFGTRGC